ncbi:MAG: ATP-binding cassette domain-containing protein, partial [Anaeroplasmataceae bacterium]|nr:ATP-binding cassette domain-containing protein [Anaeroplasmataceae bacterium]
NFSSVSSYLGKKLIEMKNGYKAFKNKILFEDFSFSLQRTDIIGIVGENGAGKTTLFKIIMGEEALDSGEIILGTTLN